MSAASSAGMPKQPTSRLVAAMRKIYRFSGFSKGYNFPLFVIFGGAMLGFVLARFQYLNFGGDSPSRYKNSAAPGDYAHFRQYPRYRIGITLHLSACLPAGFLLVFQYLPIIRYKAINFHRVNGYLIVLLTMVSNAGAQMICRYSFGGGLDTQSITSVLVVLTTVSLAMAWYNIKRLQIDQHRAWMLRFGFYMGTIITTRIIMILSALIVTRVGQMSQIRTCYEIIWIYRNDIDLMAELYPICVSNSGTNNTEVIVKAAFNSRREQIGASVGVSFGPALWMATLLHLVGVEIYLGLTSAEGQRLRNVSYERQMESGLKHPGSAGLTSDRWGDAPTWMPLESYSYS